jgi:hypothetical protein
MLARDIDGAITELLLGTHQISEPAGSLLTRAHAAAVRPASPAFPEHEASPAPSPHAQPPQAPIGEPFTAKPPTGPADPLVAYRGERSSAGALSGIASLRAMQKPR